MLCTYIIYTGRAGVNRKERKIESIPIANCIKYIKALKSFHFVVYSYNVRWHVGLM